MATEFRKAGEDNYVQDLLSRIAPEWRSEFQRFIETGEANEGFLEYLDVSSDAQDAVETAFNRQAAQFESLSAELQKRQDQASSDLGHSNEQSQTSAKLAAVVEVAMQTPSEQRAKIVDTSTAELAASVPAKHRKILKDIARSLHNNLSKLTDAAHSQ